MQPRVRLADSSQPALLDDVTGPAFLLAFADAQALEWVDADTAALWARLEGNSAVISAGDVSVPPGVIAVREDEGIFRDSLQAQQARVAVVRPDRYVYGFAADASTLRTMVRELHDRIVAHA